MLAIASPAHASSMAAWFAGGEPVHSPTFTLVNQYRHGGGPVLYHLDLYRLSGPDELAVNPRSSSAKLRAVEKIAEATGS